jgi:NADPH-dependent 7-cyano-7-deazaguanine reductase QueF
VVAPAALSVPGLPRVERQAGGESAAWETLRTFFTHRAINYRADMASPLSGWTGCSRLSPHLAFGTLSARQALHATWRREGQLDRARRSGEVVDPRWEASLRSFHKRLRWRCHFMQRLEDFPTLDREPIHEMDGLSLDRLDIDCEHYTPAPELLSAAFEEQPVSEVLTSRLLKSNCLVTGQPDWGSVQISYSGPQIEQGGLLRYLVSFRNHHEFHEQCVERIFMDVWSRCKPTRLSVYARYTRRGGLDINPFRTSHPQALPTAVRTARQ